MTTLTQQLARLNALNEKRTQGEWWHDGYNSEYGTVAAKGVPDLAVVRGYPADEVDANCSFIAAASYAIITGRI